MSRAAERRMKRIREQFDPADLKRICEATDFSNYAPRIDLPDDPYGGRLWHKTPMERFYHYRDNGSPILAVAHLDSVQWDRTCEVVDTADGPLALSGALDDRLGAYVILELLPRLGIKVDWLLTTNEEMGASTASDFRVDKDYNWIIEFDRGGKDVVMYQYETQEARDLLKKAGARIGDGSYSDIADLEHLGVAAFNWGVGYYDYHSRRAHAWLEDTFDMVSKFMRFYRANAATKLHHVRKTRPYYGTYATAGVEGSVGDLTGVSIDALEIGIEKGLERWACPDCDSDLDRWGCCWGCGYDIYNEDQTPLVLDTVQAEGEPEPAVVPNSPPCICPPERKPLGATHWLTCPWHPQFIAEPDADEAQAQAQ